MTVCDFLDMWRGGLSKREFARRLGISYRLLAGMYAGEKRFGTAAIVGIIGAYPESREGALRLFLQENRHNSAQTAKAKGNI